ncbi:hypothetical protein ABZ379_35600 [Streptomyces canus]|uniref:hypothetical protein n=1 Tax=Streptomyces canus TaxID=58343 RepID=UPI003411EC81
MTQRGAAPTDPARRLAGSPHDMNAPDPAVGVIAPRISPPDTSRPNRHTEELPPAHPVGRRRRAHTTGVHPDRPRA